MSIVIQSKKERLSPDVPYYQFSEGWRALLQRYNIGIEISEPDNLTKITVLTFPDQATLDAYQADPLVIKEMADSETYFSFAKIDKKVRQV